MTATLSARRAATTSADLRMVLPALAAWGCAAVAVGLPPTGVVLAGLLLGASAALAAVRRAALPGITLAVLAAVCLVTGARVAATASGPVADLAAEDAVAQVELEVTSDPRPVDSPHQVTVVFEAEVQEISARGTRTRVETPVVVWAGEAARAYRLGMTVVATGTLGPSDGSEQAASLDLHRAHAVDGDRAWWWAASDALRAAVTESVSNRGADVGALVPALVHGDDHALSVELADDFQDSGLTHLLAVSGTNLTLVVGFLLVIARPLGVRGRGQVVLGILGTAAFVVLARPEPSVVRAAAMGLVALVGLGSGGRGRGVRCLAWAVIALVLIDPWIARSIGFLLSALATGGILLLAPPWRDALARWMPRWCAEAVSVPMAAQLACTPAIAAISGKVSLVAVAANLLAGPAVGPATVLGLGGGVVGLVSPAAGEVVGVGSGLFARWIVVVGRQGAAFPGSAYEWGSDAFAISVLAVLCALVAFAAARVLSHPLPCIGISLATALVVVRPITPGWPPADWVMVACNVGQGDATVLNAGDGRAVVVDTGPEPRPVDRCLQDLGISQIPVIVLTHGHADHVGGIAGAVHDRKVGEVVVGPSGGPTVSGVSTHTTSYGTTRRVGDLRWTVLGPPSATDPSDGAGAPGTASRGEGEQESAAANNASVVLLVEVRGVRLLLTGDIEPDAQDALLEARPDLEADVLKVPHHGSARQDRELFASLDARFGTISAGVDNSYGHPAPRTLDLMRQTGIKPLRTDRGGDVALTVRGGRLRAVSR